MCVGRAEVGLAAHQRDDGCAGGLHAAHVGQDGVDGGGPEQRHARRGGVIEDRHRAASACTTGRPGEPAPSRFARHCARSAFRAGRACNSLTGMHGCPIIAAASPRIAPISLMSDRPRQVPPAAPRDLADDAEGADRDSRVEQLLLAGLDQYFAGRYEQAIDVWTRVAFLDRRNSRAKAYIDRARGLVAERQREVEALVQEGVAAYHAGDLAVAPTLLTRAVDRGGHSDTAQLFLERSASERAAAAAAVGAGARHAVPGERAGAPAVWSWLATAAVCAGLGGRDSRGRAPGGVVRGRAAALRCRRPRPCRPTPLPVARASDRRAGAGAGAARAGPDARGAPCPRGRWTWPIRQRPAADALRAEIQRKMLADIEARERRAGGGPMKCPKCLYIGFETGDRCKNCGYDFSLLADRRARRTGGVRRCGPRGDALELDVSAPRRRVDGPAIDRFRDLPEPEGPAMSLAGPAFAMSRPAHGPSRRRPRWPGRHAGAAAVRAGRGRRRAARASCPRRPGRRSPCARRRTTPRLRHDAGRRAAPAEDAVLQFVEEPDDSESVDDESVRDARDPTRRRPRRFDVADLPRRAVRPFRADAAGRREPLGKRAAGRGHRSRHPARHRSRRAVFHACG